MPPSLVVAHGPGRVNLIGEHTDYNGGLALPFAIERGVTVTAAAGPAARSTVQARDLGEEDTFALADLGRPGTTRAGGRSRAGRSPSWPPRARTCVPRRSSWRATCPAAPGSSSSAALAAGLCLALLGLAGEAEPGPGDRHELARLCSRVENDWVGAQTGLLDQLAVAVRRARAGAAASTSARSTSSRCRSSSRSWRLVVLDSGAAHSTRGRATTSAARSASAACAQLGVESLREAGPAAADALPGPALRRRAATC